MRTIWRIFLRTVFWSFERGTWPYDIAVAVIVVFVLLSPRSWFHDQPPLGPARDAALVEKRKAPSVVPLRHAHAHNDYEHTRPLLDALDHGFCGVEADIYLVSGKLLVAHDRKDAKPERTLQALYLDPLRERVKANGGRVYPGEAASP